MRYPACEYQRGSPSDLLLRLPQGIRPKKKLVKTRGSGLTRKVISVQQLYLPASPVIYSVSQAPLQPRRRCLALLRDVSRVRHVACYAQRLMMMEVLIPPKAKLLLCRYSQSMRRASPMM
ncbi:hypothetical protein CS238_21835 [Salmonella enterica]|nr:hypothetical protein [Salmonella enterica]